MIRRMAATKLIATAQIFSLMAASQLWLPAQTAEQPADRIEASVARSIDPVVSDLAEIDKKIMLEEIGVSRQSVQFRLNSNQQPRWRSLRFAALQNAFGGGLTALDIVLISQQASNFQAHPNYSANALRGGFTAGIVGTICGASSSTIELGSNSLIAYKNWRNGMSPAQASKRFSANLRELDRLLAKRDRLMKRAQNSPFKPLLEKRGHVLVDIRDLAVREFIENLQEEKRLTWFQNSFYALDAAKNTFGSISTGLGIGSASRATLVGPSDIWLVITGSFIVGESLLSDAAGALAYAYYGRKYRRRLKASGLRTIKDLKADMQQFETLSEVIEPPNRSLHSAATVFGDWRADRTSKHDEAVVVRRQDAQYRRTAVQQAVVGPIIGASFMAEGILGLVGAYGMPNRPAAANSLNFAGSISGLFGSLLTVEATTRGYFSSERFKARMKRDGMWPPDVLHEHLIRLDRLESDVQGLDMQG